jgi:hypothetical protein
MLRGCALILIATIVISRALEWNEACTSNNQCFEGTCEASPLLLDGSKRCSCAIYTQQVGPDCRAGMGGVAVFGSIVSVGDDLVAYAGRGTAAIVSY